VKPIKTFCNNQAKPVLASLVWLEPQYKLQLLVGLQLLSRCLQTAVYTCLLSQSRSGWCVHIMTGQGNPGMQ